MGWKYQLKEVNLDFLAVFLKTSLSADVKVTIYAGSVSAQQTTITK